MSRKTFGNILAIAVVIIAFAVGNYIKCNQAHSLQKNDTVSVQKEEMK